MPNQVRGSQGLGLPPLCCTRFRPRVKMGTLQAQRRGWGHSPTLDHAGLSLERPLAPAVCGPAGARHVCILLVAQPLYCCW